MQKTRVSSKGQVVIPKALRNRFGIKEGGEVIVEAIEEGVLIMKKEKNPVKSMTGLFEGKTKKTSAELVRDIRKEWDKRIEKLEKK